jgi:hypothetical protein
MKKDITPPEVKDIAVAVVKELNELNETEWNVYLVNLRTHDIEGVLVSSMGYGMFNNEEVKTSTLRHFLDVVKSKNFSKIEPIVETVFGLNNEFWVSFFVDGLMYDKKYIFLPETIREENFVLIPYLNKKGVMIK